MFKCWHYRIWSLFISFYVLGFAQNLSAEQLFVMVASKAGKPVKDAVIYAISISASGKKASGPATTTIIDQVDKEFIGFVTPVRAGTAVNFPNHDEIRHHVYSFSPAKKFEIPLYKGMPPNPVVFNKEGVVILGCNIHDWMSAYIYVIDTPHFTTTDKDGKAPLELPPGSYEVQTWHPWLGGSAKPTSQRITVPKGKDGETSFVIELKKVWKPRRGPTASGFAGGGYR